MLNTENNVDYRRNLYYAAQCVRLIVLMPLFIAWAWGLSTIYTVIPTATGFFILIVFSAVIVGWYTYKHLQHRAWLMQAHVLHKCAVVLLCILVYCASTVFTDPTVYHGHQTLVS
jgi:hypothetical protein